MNPPFQVKLPEFPKFRLPGLPQLPHFPKLPILSDPRLEPLKNFLRFLYRHKILISIFVFIVAFITAAMWYRGYLLSKMNASNTTDSNNYVFYSTKPDNTFPTIVLPTVPPVKTNNTGSQKNTPITMPTPFPTFAPLPTIAPIPTAPPVTTTTTTTTTTNAPSNPNCTTGAGTPNSWYSDVYPNPPITTSTGSITLIVNIRDCKVNLAPVNDDLTITLLSSDSTARINGSPSPVKIQAKNGVASFSVSSQNSTTDTFSVQDTSSNFTITDINNHNPSVTFSGNSTGNTNCTTAAGVPNFWYSDVYPASPVSANTGATVTFNVAIRDCTQTSVSSDNIKLSLTSNDSSLTINGSAPPVTVAAQNGQATFNVTSQNAGTDTLSVQDTSSNFTVTDTNNHNPSIVFSASSTTPTPTPAPSATLTVTPAPTGSTTPTPTQSLTPTPSPTTAPSPTQTP